MARRVTRGTEENHSSWPSVRRRLFLLKWGCLALGEPIMTRVQTMTS